MSILDCHECYKLDSDGNCLIHRILKDQDRVVSEYDYPCWESIKMRMKELNGL